MPGPVFERELAATARSGRAFALRSIYGLALLAVAIATYRNLDPGPMQVTRLAGDLFRNLVQAQAVAVILLTPALVAGAIAGEAQRGTLQDLLTTDLTAAEVVLGKLAARLLHVGGSWRRACRSSCSPDGSVASTRGWSSSPSRRR